jgi:hypothetical protein
MYCDRQLFGCYFLRLFPPLSALSSLPTSRHTKLSRLPFRSDKAAHAFVPLSDVHQKNGETLTSRSFAPAGVPLVVGVLVTRRPDRECVQAL